MTEGPARRRQTRPAGHDPRPPLLSNYFYNNKIMPTSDGSAVEFEWAGVHAPLYKMIHFMVFGSYIRPILFSMLVIDLSMWFTYYRHVVSYSSVLLLLFSWLNFITIVNLNIIVNWLFRLEAFICFKVPPYETLVINLLETSVTFKRRMRISRTANSNFKSFVFFQPVLPDSLRLSKKKERI